MSLLLSGSALPASEESLEAQVLKLRAQIRKDVGAKLPPVPVPSNNPQTKEKVRLGEALFFDPNLSSCAEVACATCHLPDKGFSDGKEVSPGCKGSEGRRNSSTVYQTGYLSHLFWDGRVQSLEQQALNPVVDPVEMANTWDAVISYLQTGVHPATGKTFPEAKKFYETAFRKAFEGEITTTNVAKAIAAYERTVNSFDSPFDRWVKGNDKALTMAQKKGMVVFFGRGKCSQCHNAPLFTDSDFHNIGVPNTGFEKPAQFPQNPAICKGVVPAVDPGRAEVPALHASCADVAAFRTPTLRNVALSAPYMHNGKFGTLEAAVVHYEDLSQGTVTTVAGELDPDVRKGTMLFGAGVGKADDVPNMVEFMKALTGSQIRGPKGGVAPPNEK
ncbi:MAG TPA: cytochrome c peroxidase [Thermoanaerobaculaceae bacterium]|jgi:cytochrome c peroxidase|nr:cytochrome c peroxidase [Thermoanaerobaculaceae bacterium]